jgi:hypothetical protein
LNLACLSLLGERGSNWFSSLSESSFGGLGVGRMVIESGEGETLKRVFVAMASKQEV